VLQLKRGRLRPSYFAQRYDVNVLDRFADPIARLRADGLLSVGADAITLSRDGLLRVDTLLRQFFRPEHVDVRYT